MSDTKFTKGDWVVDYKGTRGTVKALVDEESNMTPTVASYLITPSIMHSKDEAEANAHLIAAAPAMYEMLYYIMTGEIRAYAHEKRIKELLSKARGE